MKHRNVREKLSAYIDGEIDDSEKEAIEAHLRECASCRRALEDLRQTVGHVQKLEGEAPPEWLTRKIMDRVRAEADKAEPFWRKLIFPLHIKLPLEAVAMAFLVVMGAYLYQQLPDNPRVTQIPSKFERGADAPSTSDAEIESHAPAADKVRRSLQERPSAEYRAAEPSPAPSAGTAEEERTRRSTPPSRSLAVGKSKSEPEQTAPNALRESGALQTDTAVRAPSGQLTLAVGDPNEAAAAVEEYLKKSGGTRLRTETHDGDIILTVKIPGPNLASFLADLGDLGRMRGKETAAGLSGASVLRITLTDENSRR